MADLSAVLGPLRLAHPLINCSGTMEIFDLAEALGPQVLAQPVVAAYVPKTVTLQPRAGNPGPRVLETAGGMINAIGLPGPGIEAFVSQELPRLLALPCPVIVSVGGFSTVEYASLARGLRDALDEVVPAGWISRVGVELNVSCPNVHSGCASIGADPSETEKVVAAVRREWSGLLVVKLTPNVTDITEAGLAAETAGADAVAAVNTYKALVIDRRTLKPYLGNITGGLSGPAIKPLALRAVYELYERLSIPIVGMGGVDSVQDVLEFMACGAAAVAVGSSAFRDPGLAQVLVDGLADALDERGLSASALVGQAHEKV